VCAEKRLQSLQGRVEPLQSLRRRTHPIPTRRSIAFIAFIACVAVNAGCGDRADDDAESFASVQPKPGLGFLDRDATLGPFLAEHWRLPIAPQGAPPPAFSRAEASLEPEVCGSCHPQQFAQWRHSLHANAWSPGFSGQLIEGALATPSEIRDCQRCHAPLGEQQPFASDGRENGAYSETLRSRGIVCASCHRRQHRTFGPPRRSDSAIPPGALPHGGFEVQDEFTQSRFCAGCHQFFDTDGVNGKPIENTWAEWRASPMAAAGRTCQSCHMPDRAHTWRGIHDREMVREAVGVALVPQDSADGHFRATLVLLNRDVGHAFPTYVTPRVFLDAWQVTAEGAELADTRFSLPRSLRTAPHPILRPGSPEANR